LASASPPRLHFVQAEGRRRITICISLKILNAILEHRTKYKKKRILSH
jgi:transcriptional regulator of met regulon